MDPFHSYKGPLCPLREVGTYDNDTAAVEQKLSWRLQRLQLVLT